MLIYAYCVKDASVSVGGRLFLIHIYNNTNFFPILIGEVEEI